MKENIINPKKLYEYIKGIESAIKILNTVLLSSQSASAEKYQLFYGELDAKEREVVYIKKTMERTAVYAKCFDIGFDKTRMEKLRKEMKLTDKKFKEELAEDSYFLMNHIIAYEEKME